MVQQLQDVVLPQVVPAQTLQPEHVPPHQPLEIAMAGGLGAVEAVEQAVIQTTAMEAVEATEAVVQTVFLGPVLQIYSVEAVVFLVQMAYLVLVP